jgi:hypothetical protein
MKSFSFFTYCIWGVAVLAAFVVADDTTTPLPVIIDEELSVFTTPSPPPIKIIGFDSLDDDVLALTTPATPQKNKQQQIQKHIQDTEPASDDVGGDHEESESDKPKKNHKSVTTATRSAHKKKNSIHAKHMVCSVVVGSLICYSVNQEDVTFDAAECVAAPIPNSPDGKNYTVCSRSLI